MKSIQSVFLASFLLAATIMIPVTANADDGFYVGAGIGSGALEIDLGDPQLPNFDESDTGFKVFGGYNWQLSAVSLGLELAYTDFGNPTMNVQGESLGVAIDGLNVWGLAGITLGPVDLYAKIGSLEWEATFSAVGVSQSVDGSDTGYGVGLRFNAGSFQIRGEYELFEIESGADLTMLSVGVAYMF